MAVALLAGCERSGSGTHRPAQTTSARDSTDGSASADAGKTAKAGKPQQPDLPQWEQKASLTHRDVVTSVAFSPDGKKLAAGVGQMHQSTVSESLVLWEVATGKQLFSTLGTQFRKGIYAVAFARDGALAVGDADGLMALWDLPADTKPDYSRWVMKAHRQRVSSLAFSSDGKALVTASFDKTAKLWNVVGEKSKRPALIGHTDNVFAVAFSPDGTLVATASGDGTVKLWEASTGKENKTLVVPGGPVFAVAFAPDGNSLASGGADKTVRLWNLKSGAAVALKGHTGGVRCLAYSTDGKTLASGSEDKTVKLWDAARGKELITLQGHQGHVSAVAFAAGGTTLASGSEDRTVRLWRQVATSKSSR
jgi:WD40 repeat protein